MLSDIRYAVRSLLRSPGFSLAVILTLGLGIGANTAIFSVVRAVLLKPLPHQDGDRLVYLRQSADGLGAENIAFSVPEILDFRDGAKSFEGIAEYSGMTYTLQGTDDAVRINVGLVTGNYFSVMGLKPVLGRLTTPEDDGTGVPPVMVLTHEYWLNRFRGDSSIVGKTVLVDNRAVTVIGVVQSAPNFPNRMDVLMNMVISEHHTSATMVHGRTHRMTEMVARLAPGATLAQARGEVADIRKRVQIDHPDAYDAASNYTVTVTPLKEVLGERARLTLWLLMGAAAFVLIIACANVANLTLMRGVRREHELVVHTALGAGTAKLRQLLLVENGLLVLAGSLVGLLVAFGGVGMLASLVARSSPRAGEIRVDLAVLGFTLALAVVVALLLSYAPGLVKERVLAATLAGAGKSSAGRGRQRLQRALVVAQVAVSVILLTGAGLLTRSMLRLAEVDTGFDAGNEVLTMQVAVDEAGRSPADQVALYQRMQAELSGIPGVMEVGVGSTMPLANSFQLEVKAEGREIAPDEPMPRADYRTASPEFFRAAGVPIIAGRAFDATDGQGTAMVVIINKTLADRLFPGLDPIGRRVAWTGDVLRFIPVSGDWRTVVGVVADTKDDGLDGGSRPVLFQPLAQGIFGGGLVIRARGDAATMAPAATQLVRKIAPRAPIENVRTVAELKGERVAPRRLNATLVAAFGALAVLIAAVGIAGVLAFSVSARTREIGIRMSLGADSGRVQRMIISEGGILLGLGLALGLIGSLLATRLIQGLLYGVAPHDPSTLLGVALLMAVIGLIACWIPALRAARIDPGVVIRAQ
ncbi:MAG: ABC transporter permease [Gemmatimonadales bacterium]|nr:ABC transporter permease [Gemmatimonadales bacterium]